MLRRGRRIALLTLAGLLIFVCVPPFWWVARDLWLLVLADGDRAEQEARGIILSQIVSGSSRSVMADSLRPPPATASPASRPVIALNPPAFDYANDIPTCPDRIFSAVRRHEDDAGDFIRVAPFGTRRGQGFPDAFHRPNRSTAVDIAHSRLDARFTNLQLVSLNACVNATPLAGRCARWFEAARRTGRAEMIAELSRLEAVRTAHGRVCWTWPEFVR